MPQFLLWRLLNIKTLFARACVEFQARAAQLTKPFTGVINITCLGQQGLLEFEKGWCRPLDYCQAPDLTLDLDQLTFFRLLVGRDTPEELELPQFLGLSAREAEVITALFPKKRPSF